MQGLMSDRPLLISSLLDHAARYHGDTDFHSVTPITKGTRKVLVVWYPKKERLRGYNQSKYIAKGLKEIVHIKMNTRSLIRTENTDSQTRKKRFSRWENMMNSFALQKTKKLENKHILLIDDVVTTGATLEACAQKLLEIRGVKVSIITIAAA